MTTWHGSGPVGGPTRAGDRGEELTDVGDAPRLAGEDLVRTLAEGDSYQMAFMNNHLGVEYVSDNVSALVGGQTSPGVRILPGNGRRAC